MRTLAATTLLCLVLAQSTRASEPHSNWSANPTPCDQHQELLKRDRMNLGVHFSTASPQVTKAFARALDFWATILDMEWRQDNTRNCAIHIFSGTPELFRSAEVARAHFPDRPAFQGAIAVNPQVALTPEEQYLLAVHELGHLLGLRHNPSARSVMYFLCLEGPIQLDATDLAVLTARHKLRSTASDKRTTD